MTKDRPTQRIFSVCVCVWGGAFQLNTWRNPPPAMAFPLLSNVLARSWKILLFYATLGYCCLLLLEADKMGS